MVSVNKSHDGKICKTKCVLVDPGFPVTRSNDTIMPCLQQTLTIATAIFHSYESGEEEIN